MKIKNVGKINGKDVDLKVSIMGLGAIDEKTDSYDLHSHNENADRMLDFIERNKITNDFFSIRLPGENLNADTPQETFGTLAIDTTRSSVLNYSYIYSDGTPVKNEDGLISAGFDDVDWTQNITLKNSELIAYSKGSHILSPVSNSNNTSTFNSKPGEGNNGVDEGIFWGLYRGTSGNASVTFDFNSATPDRNNFPRTRWQERMLEKLDKSIWDYVYQGPNGENRAYIVEGGSFGFSINTHLIDLYSSRMKKVVSDNNEFGLEENTITSKNEYLTYSINAIIPNKINNSSLSKLNFHDELKNSEYKNQSFEVKIGQEVVTNKGTFSVSRLANGNSQINWVAGSEILSNSKYQGKTITYEFQAKPKQNRCCKYCKSRSG